MRRIGVLGAGTWGTALARMLCLAGSAVTVWSKNGAKSAALERTRTHPNLPGVTLPPDMRFTSDIAETCADKDILLFAVPSVAVRGTAALAAAHIPDGQLIVDAAKGIEPETLFTMTQVIRNELEKDGAHRHIRLVALSGPSHAEEVAAELPTAIVSACGNIEDAQLVQDAFSCPYMRVYTNEDILGVELCGALKNIIALAAGISAGLGYGDNAKAALMTRGQLEIERLGIAMGCMEKTFSGLAGIGDLIVTATSLHSRNNRAGMLIGGGMPAAEAVRSVGMVVEGVNALPAAMSLSRRYGVEVPIMSAVNDIVSGGADPIQIMKDLMGREKQNELPKPVSDIRFENILIRNKESASMKRIITYGTYDLLHYGHINLLRRAKALGDYLIVCLSTDEFNWNEKQKKCYFTYEQRKALLESIRYVDLVIPEESWEQKRTDVHEYHIDTFVMGDDWTGKFDFLKDEGCEVVYLPRTPEISTTQIKNDLNGR